MTGLSKSTIWRLEHDGLFPQRCRLGPNSVGWRSEDIVDWIESRPLCDLPKQNGREKTM